MVFKAFNYLIDRLENPLVQRCCSVSSKSLLVHNKSILAQKKQDLVNLYNTKIREQVLLNEKYIAIQEGIIEVVCYSSAENYNKETIRQLTNDVVETCDITRNENTCYYIIDVTDFNKRPLIIYTKGTEITQYAKWINTTEYDINDYLTDLSPLIKSSQYDYSGNNLITITPRDNEIYFFVKVSSPKEQTTNTLLSYNQNTAR